MHFIHFETSDGDNRWINLHQVSRVTVGKDPNGHDFLVAMFADGDVSESLKIVGSDEVNRRAITAFERALNLPFD